MHCMGATCRPQGNPDITHAGMMRTDVQAESAVLQ